MRYTTFMTIFVCVTASPISIANGDAATTQVKKALERASKAEQLPQSKAVVVFGQSEAVVLTDNPRWVVKGQLYDMWQNQEINGAIALREAAKKIPINKINVNTKDVIDARVRQEKESIVTVFLDPFMSNSSEVVRILNTYATDFEIRYIYTAMSQANIKPFFDFACQSKNMTANEVSKVIINASFTETDDACRQEQAMNSFGLTQFLHINQSPTIIAPNDTYHVGLPTKLIEWLKSNED